MSQVLVNWKLLARVISAGSDLPALWCCAVSLRLAYKALPTNRSEASIEMQDMLSIYRSTYSLVPDKLICLRSDGRELETK
jgi:hypothetical protein